MDDPVNLFDPYGLYADFDSERSKNETERQSTAGNQSNEQAKENDPKAGYGGSSDWNNEGKEDNGKNKAVPNSPAPTWRNARALDKQDEEAEAAAAKTEEEGKMKVIKADALKTDQRRALISFDPYPEDDWDSMVPMDAVPKKGNSDSLSLDPPVESKEGLIASTQNLEQVASQALTEQNLSSEIEKELKNARTVRKYTRNLKNTPSFTRNLGLFQMIGLLTKPFGLGPLASIQDEKTNTQAVHEGFITDTGVAFGFGPEGVEIDKENLENADAGNVAYDAKSILEGALATKPGNYSLLGINKPKNNCQDYTDRVVSNHDKIGEVGPLCWTTERRF